jgi:hypothetical protein
MGFKYIASAWQTVKVGKIVSELVGHGVPATMPLFFKYGIMRTIQDYRKDPEGFANGFRTYIKDLEKKKQGQ